MITECLVCGEDVGSTVFCKCVRESATMDAGAIRHEVVGLEELTAAIDRLADKMPTYTVDRDGKLCVVVDRKVSDGK